MIVLLSALAAIIPMAGYLILIWQFDKYDREPFKLVFANYMWGALGAIVLGLIGSFVFSSFISLFIQNTESLLKIGAVIVAPMVEEITKGFFLLITIANRKFDNITDGIVYGGAIGLGFGMTENFFYFITFSSNLSDWLTLIVIRTLFSAVMHCVATATFGAFLGYAKFNGIKNKLFFAFVGLVIAIIIHSMWNFTMSYQSLAPIGFLYLFITIILFMLVFIFSVRGERRIISRELKEESLLGLIPIDHIEILSSTKRDSLGWIDEKVRKIYIKAATTLAFRKMQLRNSFGASREYYQNDVDNYRKFISNLLNG